MRALAIAATGMDAQQTNLEVIANNIANINTTGFKRGRAEFTDLLYQAERAQGVANRADQSVVPEGANIGLGVQTQAVRQLHIQGEVSQTGNDLDMAIVGRGFFMVQGSNNQTLYTRAGSFNKDANGNLVTADGYMVQPQIVIPTNATSLTIGEDGTVTAVIGTQTTTTTLGQITLTNFVNEAGLKPLGDNLFQETPASGNPVVGNPTDEGFGYIKQAYLESSNVDSVKEITDLISAQRAYEMNSKVITTADDMEKIVSQNLK
jgi:flagellar basal-body rod protein FlgG